MRGLAIALIFLAGCRSPQASGIKVIAGAKLEAGQGRQPVDYSVVIISNGKFEAVGPQSAVPVPPGVEMIRGNGMTIEPVPGGNPIEAGQPANLVLKGATDRVMHNGEWVP